MGGIDPAHVFLSGWAIGGHDRGRLIHKLIPRAVPAVHPRAAARRKRFVAKLCARKEIKAIFVVDSLNDMPGLTPYILVSLLSAMIVLVMGVCLFTVSMPREPQLHNYRISRRLLGVAYVFLALIHFAGIFLDFNIHVDRIVAPFQALMFTFALIALINNSFVTRCCLLWQLVLISSIAVLSLVNRYALPQPLVPLAYAIQTGYFSIYGYYVWIFFREYRSYKRRADNFYSGDEHRRLQWVVEVFVMAAVVGIFAGVLTRNNIYFLMFICGYTILYTYLAIRYINYVGLFHRMAPVVTEAQAEVRTDEHENGNAACALARWVEEKGYLHPDIPLDTLAARMHTTPGWLSRHINSIYGQNFRSWIASLRIGESMRLMERRKDLSIEEIQEMVGIPSSSSFFRQFRAVTGATPAEYRRTVNGGPTPEK